MSKTAKALELMQRGWTTPLDTLRICGLHALSQQVTKLRRRGVDIESRIVEGQKYAEYRVRPSASLSNSLKGNS